MVNRTLGSDALPMTSMFSQNIPKRATPNAPSAADPAVQAAQRAATTAAGDVYGRAATLLTSGAGDTNAPTIARKSLLGD
jgi:hypothetical protein